MAEDRTHATFVTLGATNHGKFDRELDDYYATDPRALEMLLESESFSKRVWEPACGAGHLSEVLVTHGHDVTSTDLVDRGYGTPGVDFLATFEPVDSDIVTNPPYKYALEFVQHAIDVVTDGHKIAMLLRLNFLEGKKRRELFDTAPPARIYVASGRINCCKNGDFSKAQRDNNSAQAYAWFIWEKGYKGDTVVKWFN